ncbi:MAG: GNAT family N-acetyltransferase, partial [Raoultibacter sp.]
MSLNTDPVSSVQAIETDRLILRAFKESDASDVFDYSCNPRIGHDAGWPPHATIEDSLFFIREIASQGSVWAIVPKETVTDEKSAGTVIGSIGLIADPARPYEDALMLGYAIGEAWWNRGFVTEASQCVIRFGFENLNLSLISCTC